MLKRYPRGVAALSLSARRAWIEIRTRAAQNPYTMVALRKESVDRNTIRLFIVVTLRQSLSARRAWIEITQCRL